MQDQQEVIIEVLDDVKEHLTSARKHQRGTQTDACLADLIHAVAHLEGIVRTLVIGEAG